jgi:hypothetical protein
MDVAFCLTGIREIGKMWDVEEVTEDVVCTLYFLHPYTARPQLGCEDAIVDSE